MPKLLTVRSNVNHDKRELTKGSSPYRLKTAVLASKIMNDLASSNREDISLNKYNKQALKIIAKAEYLVDDERAEDVAKFLDIHIRSADDKARLASYYEKANAMLKGIKL